MVQVIDTGGSVVGRIGKGFGQGLAEQLPKEIERNRLSAGLKKLGDQDFSGKSQLQILGDIAKIPGITPEMTNVALSQIQKQNFINRKSPNENIPGQQNVGLNKTSNQPILESGFASPSQITEYKKTLLQEPSQSQINDLAKDFLQQNITQNPEHAQVLAKQELNQNRFAQEKKINDAKALANERLDLSLQGGGFGKFKDLPGEIQRDLIDQVGYMVGNQGLSPEQAAEKIEKIGLDLGKARNNLKDTGSFWNMFRPSSKKITELKSQREEYEKYGWGELFDDMAASELGITPLQTAHVLDPLKNSRIQSHIGKLKQSHEFGGKKIDDKKMDEIVRQITPRDSLYSIEYLLRDKGISLDQFTQRVHDLQSKKEISLTDQQKRQLKRAVSNEFRGDLLFRSF